MSGAELAAFLEDRRTLVCATLGPGGRPHLAAERVGIRFRPTRVSSWDHRKLA